MPPLPSQRKRRSTARTEPISCDAPATAPLQSFPRLGGDRTVLNEESFHAVISLERKRTERSQRPFLLMLLDVSWLLSRRQERQKLGPILCCAFPIDPGNRYQWLVQEQFRDRHRVQLKLGLVARSVVSTMLARVNGILYSALTFEEFSHISISHHIFPEEWDHDVPQRPSHPTLYPDVSRRESGRRAFLMIKRMMDVIGSMVGLSCLPPCFWRSRWRSAFLRRVRCSFASCEWALRHALCLPQIQVDVSRQ